MNIFSTIFSVQFDVAGEHTTSFFDIPNSVVIKVIMQLTLQNHKSILSILLSVVMDKVIRSVVRLRCGI